MAKAEVSDNVSQLMKMLENQEDELKRRGQRVDLQPPELVRQHHRMEKQKNDQIKALMGNSRHPMNSSLNIKICASKTAFSQLTRTTIPELTLEESAKGKYLLVRVIEDWFSLTAWKNVIEDHRGHVIGLALYNYPIDEIFSLGDLIIIKEPYLRLPLDNIPVIRCDCPTDILVLRPSHKLYHLARDIETVNDVQATDPLTDHPFPSNAMEWKERGNRFFDRGQLTLAREAYNLALVVCSERDPTSKIVQLNLLAVQLQLGYLEWVVENAEKFLKKFPDEKKAMFRLGKAYYSLRNYEKAMETYQLFCRKFPEEKDGVTELERSKKRVNEINGQFNFNKLRIVSKAKPFEEIDCADYCGPLKIRKIPGKGRGIVLTKDVTKGSVLIVSKALAAVLSPLQTQGFQIEPEKIVEMNRDRAENAAKLAWLIMKNPNVFGSQVYDLHPGENSIEPARLFCDQDLKEEPISDVGRIKNISDCNSFAITEKSGGVIKPKGAALFVLPSYINHSCTPNTNAYEFYNDIMVVRALKDMKKGTELTISYIPLNQSFEERAKSLANRGFKCRCSRCKNRM